MLWPLRLARWEVRVSILVDDDQRSDLDRYVEANWDLGEVEEKYKTQIIEKDLFVSKLALPS